jgi:hypothetical protein
MCLEVGRLHTEYGGIHPETPSFPFQYVVGDYFSLAGINYLILIPNARLHEVSSTDGVR